MNSKSTALAGWLLLSAILSIDAYILFPAIGKTWAAIGTWGAALLLWPLLKHTAKRQVIILLSIGLCGIAWGIANNISPNLSIATSGNALLLTMLAAVSFLRLITHMQCDNPADVTPGRRSLWHSLFAVHLFGAVINLSTVFIMGDHLSKRRPLSETQLRVLTRGFSAAAFWSPFFAAMAAALTYAPGANLQYLWLSGIPLALLALGITAFSCRSAEQFVGYPMHLGALWLPALLALAVLLIHQVYPELSVLGVICLLAPLITVITLWLKQQPVMSSIKRHITQDLPGMHNELALFLAAGVMASGLGSVFASLGGWLPFNQFSGSEAVVTLWFMLLTSLIGVHPVINIATIGTLLIPLQPNSTLLAMTFLSGWAIGVVNTPYSGLSLAMQGRYGLPALALTRINGLFSLSMAVLASMTLWLFDRYFLY